MKNWTVISKPVKKCFNGLSAYTHYLTSRKHRNHKRTRIVRIHNTPQKFVGHCTKQVFLRDIERDKSRKGGRPISSYAQSFVFSMPPDIQLTDTQWKAIAKSIYFDLARFLDLSPNQLKDSVFINLHDQKNQHLNIVVSKVINGRVAREVQQKGITQYLKLSFNNAVLRHGKHNHKSYVPKTSRHTRYSEYFFKKHKTLLGQIRTPDFLSPKPKEIINSVTPKQTKKRKRRFV